MTVKVLDILKQRLYIILTYFIFWHIPWSLSSSIMEISDYCFAMGTWEFKINFMENVGSSQRTLIERRIVKASEIGIPHQRDKVKISTFLWLNLLFDGA